MNAMPAKLFDLLSASVERRLRPILLGAAMRAGANLQELETLIAAQQAEVGPLLHLGKDGASIGADKAPEGGADVWLVRYVPEVINVRVKRGENSDRTLPHGHVVRSMTRIGGWSGMPADFIVAPPAGGLRTAILVQRPKGGPILAAATD